MEKLSEEHSLALLQGGALKALLSFFGFFGLNVQRSIISTVANICRNITSDYFDHIEEHVGTIGSLLLNQDVKSSIFLLLLLIIIIFIDYVII